MRKSILIIEDHDSIRKLLTIFLSKDYEVVAHKDGLEGISWLGKGNFPDLILLDMEMPRLDGISFLKNLRNSGFFGDIPIVVISGSNEEQYTFQCEQLAVKHFFNKPFNPLILQEKITHILS